MGGSFVFSYLVQKGFGIFQNTFEFCEFEEIMFEGSFVLVDLA